MVHYAWWKRRKFGGTQAKRDAPHLPLRTWAGTWKRENVCGKARGGWNEREVRGEGECGLRGPHGVVKSIRPGLEPRLLALLTAVRRERHQRDWGDLEDIGVAGGVRGPRIKYHPRYVPFENATSFSILSLSLRFLLLRISKAPLWISHLFTFRYVLNASLPVSAHACHSHSQIWRLRCNTFAFACHRVFKEFLIECIDALEMQNRHERSEICMTSH